MSVHRLLRSKKKAVSLMELIVAVATSIIIAGVVSGVFINSWRAQIAQEAYTELQQKGRISIDEISSVIKISSGIVASVTSGSDTYTTSDSVIVVKTPSLDASNNILPADDHYIFKLNDSDPTKLDRIVIADTTSSRINLASQTTINNVMGSLSFIYYDSINTVLTPGVSDITTSTSVFVEVDSQKDVNNRTINRKLDNLVYLKNLP